MTLTVQVSSYNHILGHDQSLHVIIFFERDHVRAPCILEYIWISVTVYLLKHHPKYWMKIFSDHLSGNLVCGDGNCGGRYHRTDDCCRKPWWLFSKTLLLIELSIVEDKHINQYQICLLDLLVKNPMTNDEVSANSATPIPRRDEKSDGSQDALLEDSHTAQFNP